MAGDGDSGADGSHSEDFRKGEAEGRRGATDSYAAEGSAGLGAAACDGSAPGAQAQGAKSIRKSHAGSKMLIRHSATEDHSRVLSEMPSNSICEAYSDRNE